MLAKTVLFFVIISIKTHSEVTTIDIYPTNEPPREERAINHQRVLKCMNSLEDSFVAGGPFMGRLLQVPMFEESPSRNELRKEVLPGTYQGTRGLFLLTPDGARFVALSPVIVGRTDEGYRFRTRDAYGNDLYVNFLSMTDEAYDDNFIGWSHMPASEGPNDVFRPESYVELGAGVPTDFTTVQSLAEKLITSYQRYSRDLFVIHQA